MIRRPCSFNDYEDRDGENKQTRHNAQSANAP